ncbi:alpha,alpha-phosphotrehalase [Streptobacillus canis]|uniref:alpha,alpha-phosphotrehalase n=1 Tax=Streptobacillus canis TaxID=2678686 RepID=UPI001E42C974|nr:alpha,alpha-phosphotrehalase [Streptobacillus canis]
MKKKKITVYQIYIKSFNDTSGNGIGDIKGITEKLEYLKELGIDYIWITPFFKSPQKDNGYDVSNYYEIDPIYGNMLDFEKMSDKAKKLGIGIMLDMVFNHTSTEHEWFKKALSGEKEYQDYYIFKDKSTNWQSKFGGSAWEYVEKLDKYYLHLFDKTQADLNWENPKVREELKKVLRFWLKKGVNGFRFDVVNLISKPFEFIDDNDGDGRRFYTDGPRIHEYIKELSEEIRSINKDAITVGEMSSTSLEHCQKYSGENENELSMVFNFHHLKVDYKNNDKWQLMPFDFKKLKQIFNEWQVGMQKASAWSAMFWSNHDQPRIVSRLGDDVKYHEKSAKMLATVIHLLRGIPYIYQGEEIGMTNAGYENILDFNDVESHNYYNILKEKGLSSKEALKVIQERSRDNGRTPMQWSDDVNGGFSINTPWLKVVKNYKKINVKKQLNDENSILNYYKKLIKLRKKYNVISEGEFEQLDNGHDQIYSFRRYTRDEEIIIIANFYNQNIRYNINKNLEEYECILSNTSNTLIDKEIKLEPYDVYVLYKNNI